MGRKSRYSKLVPNDNIYVIESADQLPSELDQWRIYHLLYDPGDGIGLYFSPDNLSLVKITSASGVLPVGTVSDSLLRWNTGSLTWSEFTAFILPLVDGASGQVMVTDSFGTVTWQAQSVTAPAGANEEIQYNDSGAFGASPRLRWDVSESSLDIDVRDAGVRDGAIHVVRMQEDAVGLRIESINGNTTFHNVWQDYDPNGESSWKLTVDSTSPLRLLTFIDDPSDVFIQFQAGFDGLMRFGGNDGAEFVWIDFTSEAFAIRNGMTLFMEEIAVANPEIALHGQVWVRSDTPNNLMYTDDAGTDFVIGGTGAPKDRLLDPLDNIAVIALGLGISAIRSVGNLEAEDRELRWQHADGTTQFSIGSEFFTDMIIRNWITGRHVIIRVGKGAGNRIRAHFGGDQTTGGVSLYAGTSGTPKFSTVVDGVQLGGGLAAGGGVYLIDKTAQSPNHTNQGQLWVDQADDNLHFITELGVDYQLTPPAPQSPWLSDIDGDGFDLNDAGVIFLREQTVANPDVIAQGQIWVRDDVPNVLMYTDDASNDFVLNFAPGTFGDVFKVGTPLINQVGVWTGDGTIEGDANFTYGANAEQMKIGVDLNSINNVGLLLIDTDSVLNPDGWGIMPGQAGLHDGTLIITHDPTDTINNRDLTMIPGARPAFGFGVAVPPDSAFADENAGALAYFQPRDTTGREETKISFVGFVGGTGHEGVLSIEGYNYGDSGLQFNRVAHFVVDPDYRIHIDLLGAVILSGAAALESTETGLADNLVDGLQLQGQGSSRDITMYDDSHQITLSSQTGLSAWRFHKRFQVGTYVEFHMNNATDDFEITGAGSCDNILWTGYDGLFDIDSDLTVHGIRPSGIVQWDKGANIASAAALILGLDGNSFTVTGTTTITSISAEPIGTVIILQFAAALTLTYNATALDLSGDVDMVTEANDTLGLYCYDGTNWRELFRTDGQNVRVSGSIADQSMVRGNGGAKRVQDTGNLIGDDDEIVMAGFIQFQTFTDTQLNDITDAVNTTGAKVQGAQAYNSTQDVPVWAVGAADGSVWVDGAGTTVNTPV